MLWIKRCNKLHNNEGASLNPIDLSDGYITTLHPEGSFDGTRIHFIKRELVRPKINYWIALINVLIPVIVCIIVSYWNIHYAIIGFVLYLSIRLNGIIIWIIRLYQRFASDDIRLECVFEPSCSEYMILSINKYGVIYGGFKGINRLKRCHLPNGGPDYP